MIVRTTNQAPSLLPIGDQIVTEGETLAQTINGIDGNNDALSYFADGLPQGASLNGATGEFTFTPRSNQQGEYSITFTATDGNLTDEETITLTVENENAAPRFVPLGIQTAARSSRDSLFGCCSRHRC